MSKLVLIDPHESPCLREKGRGVLEHIWEHANILRYETELACDENHLDVWIRESGLGSSNKIGIEDINGAALVFDLRHDYRSHCLRGTFKKFSSIIVYANHFMVVRDQNIKILRCFDGEIHVLLENAATMDDFMEYVLRGRTEGVFFYIVSPAIDSKCNDARFEAALYNRKFHNKCVMATGSIYKHKISPRSWWQKKYKVNDYFPDRSTIHELSAHFPFNSFSSVIADYSNNSKYFSYLARFFGKMAEQAPSEHKYYNFSLPDAFSQHSFVFVPSDIFGVVPQTAFQAMTAGCIVVGTDSPCFSSLGFQDGVNYLSIGDVWNLRTIDNFFKRIDSLSVSDIDKIAFRSKELVTFLKCSHAANIAECLYRTAGIRTV